MEGGTCILGQTFWSVESSESGLEAYVEQNNRKKQIKFYIVRTNMMIPYCSLSYWLELLQHRRKMLSFSVHLYDGVKH